MQNTLHTSIYKALLRDNLYTAQSFNKALNLYDKEYSNIIAQGNNGENLLCKYINLLFENEREDYFVHRNVYLYDQYKPYYDRNRYSECDIIIVCNSGIHLIEYKNYSNSIITGKYSDEHWTAEYSNKTVEVNNHLKQVLRHYDYFKTFCQQNYISYINEDMVHSYLVYADTNTIQLQDNPTKIFVGNQIDFLKRFIQIHHANAITKPLSSNNQIDIHSELEEISDSSITMKFIYNEIINGRLWKLKHSK